MFLNMTQYVYRQDTKNVNQKIIIHILVEYCPQGGCLDR